MPFYHSCILSVFVAVFSPTVQATPLSEEPNRLLYQIYVRAFWDGSPTPDGEGDFAGLSAKVDYLAELGVTGVLLMPIFESTGDMGYIPRDYFRADRAYGDQQSFRVLADALHARGIKVILDAPVNHISWDSPWYLRGSQKRCDPADVAHDPEDPDNRYCDYFYFSPDPCHELPYAFWHKPWKWDTTDCQAVWFRRPGYNPVYHRPDYHYATFFDVMPDLKFWDFETEEWNRPVVAELERFFRYWADLGADGFRIDAAKHFVEGKRGNDNPLEPRNLELLQHLLATARERHPDVSFIGEIWAGHAQVEPYIEEGSLDMVLDFPFMEAVRDSVGSSYGARLKSILAHFAARQDDIKPGHRVVFSGNHDVTRLMSEWADDESKVRLAHFLTLTTPFTPLLYYGEEIGMHGRVKRPDADSNDEWVRTINAFPWAPDQASGFPGGVNPLVQSADNVAAKNLVEARLNPRSTFHLVKELAALRAAFGISPATRLALREDLYGHVLGFTLYQEDSRGQRRCRTVLANFDAGRTYTIDGRHGVGACGGGLTEVFSENARRLETPAGSLMYAMEPYGKVMLDD